MSSKEIENILLSEREDDLSKIDTLLETNYKETLQIMFEVFFKRVLTGPSLDIDIMLSNIENIVLKQDIKNIKLIISSIKHTIYKFSKLNINENVELKNIRFRLLDIIRKLNELKDKKESESLYQAYYSIIFTEKNLSILELTLKQETNILGRKDSRGKDLFYNILDYYSNLEEENTVEIDYFREVIMLFLRSAENIFARTSKNYYELLERESCQNKKHVIEIKRWLDGFSDIDIVELKRKYDISKKVHEDIIKEISSFKLEKNGRLFVDTPFITIDDEDALCLDDALSMIQNSDGSYTYYVGITDIPSVVPYHSRTFYDAMRKIETLYLCDDVIELYHPKISHDLCSLVAGQYRNAIIYKFTTDPYFSLDLDSLEIIKGIIKVSNRLSYNDVNKQQNMSTRECKMIEDMHFLTSKLKILNSRKESYRRLENLVYPTSTYHHSIFSDKSISANIVQESMLLVNSAAPRYFSKNGYIYNYRDHRLPKEREIKKEIDRLLKMDIEGLDRNEYIKTIENIKKMYLNAYYSIENLGHEGLGYDFYSHSSSSARRFSDSFNQYLTYFQVFEKIDSDKKYYELEETAKEVINYLNTRKRENSKFESEYNYLVSKKRTLEKK